MPEPLFSGGPGGTQTYGPAPSTLSVPDVSFAEPLVESILSSRI